MLQQPAIEFWVGISGRPGIVTDAGIDRETNVAAAGFERIDGDLIALDADDIVHLAVEGPDRQMFQNADVVLVAGAADRNDGGEAFRMFGRPTPGAVTAHA